MTHDITASPEVTGPGGAPRRPMLFAGRYVATALLESGVGMTTHRGVDLDTGEDIVVKSTPVDLVPEGTRRLLDHEAAVLASIDSPNVSPVSAVGVDAGRLYVVMPLVIGVTLEERLLQGPLDLAEALIVAEGLLAALADVARVGILHRDVKPANVMVSERSPIARVTLIDFGLSRSDHLDGPLHDLALGSARYSSPEQAGLISHGVDERSDLYSAGAVIFETLVGRPPFDGPSVREMLRQHVTATVPSLRSLGAQAPRALDELVHRLLEKDPRNRYQTAEAALADLREIRDAIRSGVEDPRVVIGAHDRRCCVLGEPTFVGREAELGQLGDLCARIQNEHRLLVGIEAESGRGKSRLLDEFAARCSARGAWVVRGQGVDQMAQRPFQTLQGIVDAVVATASTDEAFARRIRDGLGDHRAAACSALPGLCEVLDPDPSEALGPEAFGADRSIAAIAALLDAIGDPDRPAVLLLDDCQWADPLTVKLLTRWRQASPATTRTLVVVAYRSEEVAAGHPLRSTPEDSHLALASLGDADIADLVESMAGELDTEAIRTVCDLADGSPFMASATLLGLVESGALTCRHPGWTVDHGALAAAQASNRSAAFLSRRLDLLTRDALAVLSAGAVLGKEWDLDLAARLAGVGIGTALDARQDARRRHLVWVRGRNSACSFVHDKIREAVLARLDPVEQRRLHGAAAEAIEAADTTRVFDLAYHFDAAGLPDRALPYALAAADQARARHSPEIAERQYEIAAKALTDADDAVRYEVAVGRGETTMLLGRYDEARSHLEAARALATNDLDRADLESKLAELAFKHGDLDASATAAEAGLRLLGHRIPRGMVGFVLAAAFQVLVQALHTLLPTLFVGRRPIERGAADLMAARLYSRLAHVYWFSIGPIPTLWTHLKEMNLAERYPPTREVAQAYSEHAPVMTLIPWISRGVRYVDRSLEIRRDLNDVWGQGQSLNFSGIVLFTAGRYDEAIEACQEAIRLLARTGDQWELNIARLHLAYSMYRLGRIDEAVDVARECHADGLAIGDVQASGIGVEIWSLATGGELPEDVVAAELNRPTRDIQIRVEVLQAEGIRRLAIGDLSTADALFDQAVRDARQARVRNEYTAPARAWRATVRRQQAEMASPYARGRRRSIRRAQVAARSARLIAATYPNNRAHALRESALVAALAGRRRRARRWMRRSIAAAEARGQRGELAASLDAFATVGDALGWAGTGGAATEAARVAAEIRGPQRNASADPAPSGEGITLSLVDRFSSLLDQGRSIARGLTREAVFSAVEQAAIELLRAEHCVVLGVEGIDSKLATDGSFTASMVREAVESLRPVIARDRDATAVSDSLMVSGISSAICAPILEHGRVTACFYATHGRLSDLFGDDELRLAEFVATLAGAALENARGFGEVEALKRSLEERVEARTGQLTTTLHELERLNTELRDANEAKSDFVSMVSHELRTPLTPIVGLSSTMMQRWRTMTPETVSECVEAIHRQGTRLTRLVDDLLEVARIESGTIESEPRQVNIAHIIGTTISEGGHVDTPIRVDCPPDLLAMADPDRLQQILTNYLENARKYGAPPFSVTASAAGPWVQVSVEDHGPGVPAEFIGNLFDKFARAGAVKDVPGTGLGLSIVQGLARAQGGEAWYEPGEPDGSRFCVRLPRPTVSSDFGVLRDSGFVGT